jgi:hypothetical protein
MPRSKVTVLETVSEMYGADYGFNRAMRDQAARDLKSQLKWQFMRTPN